MTPLTETVIPFFPGKPIFPTPVIDSEQLSVATLRGIGDFRVLKLKRANLSPVDWLVAPVSVMKLVLSPIALALASPEIWNSASSLLIFPTSMFFANTLGFWLP